MIWTKENTINALIGHECATVDEVVQKYGNPSIPYRLAMELTEEDWNLISGEIERISENDRKKEAL